MEITIKIKKDMEMKSEKNVNVVSGEQERGMSTAKLKKRQRLMKNNEETSGIVKNLASPKPIVGMDYIEDIPVREAFVGILRQKKEIAFAIESITSILPGFRYLKRCSGDRLLLAFVKRSEGSDESLDASFASAEELKSFLIDKKFSLHMLQDNFDIVQVPERASRTKTQFKSASKVWPLNFHPDPNIEAVMSGDFFNSLQLNVIETCMRLCIEAAKKSAVGNEYCNGSVVILNPDDEGVSKILAVSTSRVNEHPMWHAALLAIDLVARIRGAGAWKLDPSTNVNEEINSNKKREFKSDPPLIYPQSLNSIMIPKFEHSAALKVAIKSVDDEKNSPYLCTNYWVFLLQEPCSLCAMALLHSRVSMIFYGTPNNSHGVLGSKALLHTLPGLNHRYKVWSGILESECRLTTEKLIEIVH